MATVKKVAVIGIGHFGLRLISELVESGAEVLAIDKEERRAEAARSIADHVMILDSTDESALESVGLEEYSVVVVGIGESFESALLTVAHLQKLEVKKIMSRVCNESHERILKQMNVHDIILPEGEGAKKVAQQINLRGVEDSISISQDFIIVNAKPPEWTLNKPLSEIDLRGSYQIDVVTLIEELDTEEMLTLGKRRLVKVSGIVSGNTRIEEGKKLLLFGAEENIKRFLNENE